MALLSRNDIEKYSYFFVTRNNKRTLSRISLSEFFVFQFENPVSEERGKAYLRDEFVTDVYAMSDDFYKKESFAHPKYTNQKNLPISFKFTELPVTIIRAGSAQSISPASPQIVTESFGVTAPAPVITTPLNGGSASLPIPSPLPNPSPSPSPSPAPSPAPSPGPYSGY